MQKNNDIYKHHSDPSNLSEKSWEELMEEEMEAEIERAEFIRENYSD